MRTLTILAALTIGIFTIGRQQTATAAPQDVASTVDALRAATVAGEIDAIVGFYGTDAAVVSPFGTFTGPDQIRAFYTGFLAMNPGLSVTFVDRTVSLSTEVHHSLVTSESIRAAGVSRIRLTETIVVVDGTIRSAAVLLDLTDPETVRFAAALAGG